MSRLPAIQSDEDLKSAKDDVRLFQAALKIVCQRHNVSGEIVPITLGSRPIFRIGERAVIKWFPPGEGRDDASREISVLCHLQNRLPVPTPQLQASGEIDGWVYCLMSKLDGAPADQIWNSIDTHGRQSLCREVGETLRSLHDLARVDIPHAAIDWGAFVRTQRQSCAQRQKHLQTESHWVEQIDPFLNELFPTLESKSLKLSLLHTEIMRQHVFVSKINARWKVAGILDFEPALYGAWGYEFAAVGIFFTMGEPGLLTQVLLGYGLHDNDLTESLQQEFMAWTLVHRYCNLPFFMRMNPVKKGIESLSQLAAHWWTW